MRISNALLQYMRKCVRPSALPAAPAQFPATARYTGLRRPGQTCQRRHQHNPADDKDFTSLVDLPPQLVRVNRKHPPTIYLLAAIPVTAFLLGSWQIQRLGWKTDLIARLEDRLVREPLPLPPTIDPEVIPEYDYRRVYATGKFRHDQEMLIGPRLLDGEDGYMVVTPLEREGGSKILVNRGWISKTKRDWINRPAGLPSGEVVVQGLLREPFTSNMFTPANVPEKGQFYFPDVKGMAEWSGSQPVWVECTMQPDLFLTPERASKGIPVGRPAEVNLRNNHTQYIFTWYSLSLATSIMFWMVLKRPVVTNARVRASRQW